MLKYRLQTAKAAYPRARTWRTIHSFIATPSDSFTPDTREIRNIRRLKPRRLRLQIARLGQRRIASRMMVHGFPWVSDARAAQSIIGYKVASTYGKTRRPR